MSLALTRDLLLSRRIRVNAAAGKVGRDVILPPRNIPARTQLVRKIGKLTKLQSEKNKDGGILGFLWNKGTSLLGFIAKAAWNFLSFSATTIFSWVVAGVEKLKAFDWNASDKALQESIKNSNVAIATIWGSLLGQGVGWLAGIAVGYGVSLVVPVIGGAGLAKLIASKTAKEALEELAPSLGSAITSTVGILGGNLAVQGYINFRRMLKNAPRPLLEAVYGKDGADFIQKIWGREGGPNMSFNVQVEEAVESIQNKALQAFIDSLLEEAWDSFIEAGFVVANEIDQAYSQSRQAAVQALGSPRSVELTLDAKAEPENREKLQLVKMPQKMMIQQVQSQISNYRVMQNRNVGLMMGLPIEEYTRAKPQSLRLVIDLYSRKSPPYFAKTDDLVWATVTIPDLKRSALDWEVIKLAVGGTNGYQWGRFRATAQLSTGRRIVIHCGSEKEAEERINALLKLTTADLTTLNITEEKKAGERITKRKLYKESTRIYPGYFTVINRQELLDPEQGRASTRQKNYRDANAKIPLWVQKEPENAKDLIRRILTKGL
ncbi:MAG: hypothetical protein IGS48_02425 [Oscillatoriales cyanobacterium C42_A2020_001]|nr:hypothetical protein [Leptolyngbyaceae cyanobacterium C42_A2020_001]